MVNKRDVIRLNFSEVDPRHRAVKDLIKGFMGNCTGLTGHQVKRKQGEILMDLLYSLASNNFVPAHYGLKGDARPEEPVNDQGSSLDASNQNSSAPKSTNSPKMLDSSVLDISTTSNTKNTEQQDTSIENIDLASSMQSLFTGEHK